MTQELTLIEQLKEGWRVDWCAAWASDDGCPSHAEGVTTPDFGPEATNSEIRKWAEKAYPERLVEEAFEAVKEAVGICGTSRDHGINAANALLAGDLETAKEEVESAASIEGEYGDCPYYGDLREEICTLYHIREAIREARKGRFECAYTEAKEAYWRTSGEEILGWSDELMLAANKEGQ